MLGGKDFSAMEFDSRLSLKQLLCLLWICYSVQCTIAEETTNGPKPGTNNHNRTQTTVILFGSLGDLARRYLWPGLHMLFISKDEINNNREDNLRIFATGRKQNAEGSNKLQDFLSTQLCSAKIFSQGEKEKCGERLSKFSELCSYHRTKNESDYSELSDIIENGIKERGVHERARVFYLSVPSFAYASIVELINKYLQPKESSVQLRIVLEKPFGQDEMSARNLGKEILKYFKESEIYRVDHYLGKQTVDELWKFRANNHKLFENIWNNKFIERIEVVMKEKNDCKGRTEFYDKYGVVLDVMQNHLTEVLARVLVQSSLLETNKSFDKLKLGVLQSIASPGPEMTIAGQYGEYNKHVMEDRNSSTERESSTATFAAAVLYTSQTLWENVPILMMSGKQLNEKSGYVKIIFKTRKSFNPFADESFLGESDKPSFIKFYVHSAKYNGPAIEIQNMKDAFKHGFSSSWYKATAEEGLLVIKPKKVIDAYVTLIDKIYTGDRSYFVEFDSMIEAWRIWDPVQLAIQSKQIPLMKYDIKQNKMPVFHYNAENRKLRWNENVRELTYDAFDAYSPANSIKVSSVRQKTFLGSRLVRGSLEYLIESLSSDILKGVNDAAVGNNVYHIALPGGSSVKPLLRKLCELKDNLQAHSLHIWIVDERCVPLNHSDSNFNLIHNNLLKCLQIPYHNIHPMPVGNGNLMCNEQNLKYYQKEMKSWIPSMKLDLIILGVGTDGHIASLFPGDNKALHSTAPFIITDKGPHDNTPIRMSMTLELINSAKKIAVVVTGEKKKEVISLLKTSKHLTDFPVSFLKQDFSSVTWYIDNVAFGKLDVLN